uniref:Cilia- and flagella-associated protein 61 N-terminal domain-containing protein n=1 Tax=Eptatretus burgeri TaxID=7764 RepID=A0A8C4X0J9_EPTBU
MKLRDGASSDYLGSLYVCLRATHFPKLQIRQARVEDNDDLVKLFEKQEEQLMEEYGEFFLAELIAAQDKDNHLAVGEVDGSVVGFMGVHQEVNVELLSKCFHLESFHGLCKLHPEDVCDPNPFISTQSSTSSRGHQDQWVEESLTHQKDEFLPTYKGASSAFCIQLFCVNPKYEMRYDIDKQFCVMTVPPMVPELPLLQSFYNVPPRHNSTFPQDLYVFHRVGLLINIFQTTNDTTIRFGLNDTETHNGLRTPSIHFNLSSACQHEFLPCFAQHVCVHQCACSCDPKTKILKVCHLGVVDHIILQDIEYCFTLTLQDIEFIHAQYNIEDFIDFEQYLPSEHACLQHFVLNPAFVCFRKYYLRELFRLSNSSSFYYQREGKTQGNMRHTLSSVLHSLVPVRPRRQVCYPLQELGALAPLEEYTLFHINRKLTLEPKVTVNARLVIVGASDTGMSFLETLIFSPHLHFSSLTLISTHGLPGDTPPDHVLNTFLLTSHSYSPELLACMPFHSHITVVKGKMHKLDRSGKHVILDDGTSVLYDFLVLCTGQQLQVPCPTGADMSQHPTNSEVPNTPDRCYTGIVPPNLFVLNDMEDCRLAHNWLQQNFLSGTGNAVVYGNRLEAHTIIQALLQLGISGSRLHLVEPPLRVGPSCFNNFAIEEAARAALLQAGVIVHSACLLAHWSDGKQLRHGDLITSVSFTTDTKALSLPCAVLFCCYRRTVDQTTFLALNDAGLVYNGGLVVDSCFRTNDPVLWAAGPLTTYSRRYHAGQWSHSCYSSQELGFQLATTLLPLLDPTLELPEDLTPEMDCLLPAFSAPKVKGGLLPGGFHYLHIAKPGIDTYLEAQMRLPDYGQELVTGSASEGNYFRLHINQYGMVETITCLSKEELPVGNFLSLYGCHERLLNNLSSRFHEGIIPDFYKFFKQSWCLAIFHDRFQHLGQELRRLASTRLVRRST